MKLTLLKGRQSHIMATLFSSLFLISCEGSSTSEPPDFSQLSGAFEEAANAPQAVSISTSDKEEVNLQARAENTQFNIEDTGKNLAISIGYQDITSATHTQIFLNTDNNASTGFGFNGIAWGVIGADYLIQNQYLYRSISNTDAWNWEPVSKLNSYVRTDNRIELSINKNLIGAACGTIKAGTIGRNESWGIEAMYPVATKMMSVPLAACLEDVTRPVVKLIGDTEISITQGEVFNDPGASALDDVDGDISELITTSGTVNTAKLGTYTIIYISTDSSGNSAISPVRKVTVKRSELPLLSIGLDGNWDSLINQQRISFNSGFLRGLIGFQDQKADKIYLNLIIGYELPDSHMQIYLDTDNNPSTGYQVWNSESPTVLTGAEYIIEDGRMVKYQGTGVDWNWSNDEISIPYSYQTIDDDPVISTTSIKAIVPTSIVTGQTIGVTTIYVLDDWSRYSIFTEHGTYALQTENNNETN